MNVCERIIEARGGDLIVRIEPVAVRTLVEAARMFGLCASPEPYFEISEGEAAAVLGAVLMEDMAYHCPLVPLSQASALAEEFVGAFRHESARYFTNGEYGKPRERQGIGASWYPATGSTFDTGVLVLSQTMTGCAWFMDED